MLSYIHEVANGGRPYYDFIDLYGPLSWHLPAFFYVIFGEKVLGIRIFLIIIKLFTVGVAYIFVKNLTDRFYAFLTLCLMAVLLGQPWQFLQSAYPFHMAFLLSLIVWHLLINHPFPKGEINLFAAAIITAAIIWTKLNSGMLLFAGGLFYCFYWFPVNVEGNEKNRESLTFKHIFLSAQYLGIIIYGLVFSIFIHEYFNKLYFYYLLFPLLLILALTAYHLKKDSGNGPKHSYLSAFLWYGLPTLFFFLLFQIGYFGWKGGIVYWQDMLGIMTRFNYMAPFPLLGLSDVHVGFNTYYWPQLPWLCTLMFCIWLVLQRKESGKPVFRKKWKDVFARMVGLYVLVTINGFVIYSRSDETHLFKIVLYAVPVMFPLLFQIEQILTYRRINYLKIFRYIVVFFVVMGITTIGTRPGFSALKWGKNVWHSERLSCLKFYNANNKVQHKLDVFANEAAAFIDDMTDDGTPILNLSDNQLINFNSHTVSIAGKYRFLFYLLSNRFIDRELFDQLTPPLFISDILNHPPEIIVGDLTRSPILEAVPEFGTLIQHRYMLAKQFDHILVFKKLS